MNIDKWINQVSDAYKLMGKEFTQDKRRFLLSNPTGSIAQTEEALIAEFSDVIVRFFFKKAVAGDTFGPISRIKEQFGQSLEENYGLSDGPFLNLSRTFWTYKVELGDLILQQNEQVLSILLQNVEMEISSVFFPTPGPHQIPIEQRKEAQRMFLQTFAPEIEIDAFLENNPILGTKTTFIDGPLFKRMVPVIWGIVYIILALILIVIFGSNIINLIICGLLIYLAYKSIRVAISGSQRLIDEMTSDKQASEGSKDEYGKL